MGEIRPEDTTIPKSQMTDLLRKVCSVLNDNNIKYFLTCGTLLGYIREEDFIEWDTDIDLGIFDVEDVYKLEDQFVKNGLRLKTITPEHSLQVSLKLQIVDTESDLDSRLHLDFFEFENSIYGYAFRYIFNRRYIEFIRNVFILMLRIINNERHSTSERVIDLLEGSNSISSRWKQISRYLHKRIKKYQYRQGIHIFEPFTCVKANWFGFPIMIPSKPDDHLRLLYGNDWRIPNPEYSQSLERQLNIRRVRL